MTGCDIDKIRSNSFVIQQQWIDTSTGHIYQTLKSKAKLLALDPSVAIRPFYPSH